MKQQTLTRIVRGSLLFAIGIWGWYAAATFRTSDWGYDNLSGSLGLSFMIYCMFALPIAFGPLIGLSWRWKASLIAALTLLCLSSVELYARGQEHLLIRRLGHHPVKDYMETRWWPFQHHSLGFINGEWVGCD